MQCLEPSNETYFPLPNGKDFRNNSRATMIEHGLTKPKPEMKSRKKDREIMMIHNQLMRVD